MGIQMPEICRDIYGDKSQLSHQVGTSHHFHIWCTVIHTSKLVTSFGVSLLKIQVWDAMPCWLVCSCWHYEVGQYLLLEGQGIQKEWHISDCL